MPIFECARCNDMTYSASAGALYPCARCGSATIRVVEGGFAEARTALRDLARGDHSTLVHDDHVAIAPFCARYLTEGVEADERVVAAVRSDLRAAIVALLAPGVLGTVEWQEPGEVYADFDADRVAAMYDEMIGEEPRTTRILAGLDSADGVDAGEFDRYERLAHEIVTGRGANVICLFDSRVLPPEFIELAVRRHGLAVSDGAVRRNERFEYAPA
jgi:hypothetical protein